MNQRFSSTIPIAPPRVVEREAIIRGFIKKRFLGKSEYIVIRLWRRLKAGLFVALFTNDIRKLSDMTEGLYGADLQKIVSR